jgi:hypothetical protein
MIALAPPMNGEEIPETGDLVRPGFFLFFPFLTL